MSDEPILGELLTGMLGWSAEDISINSSGWCWFPTGKEDSRYTYGYKWEKHRVTSIEDVRQHREVIIVDGDRQTIKEHTPVDAKILGYIYDDYSVQAYTGTEIKYIIGTSANASDSSLPSSFVAERMYLLPTTNCLVRFEANTRVQHLLIANIQYFYQRRCKEIFIVRQTVNGSLTIRALGNEVGV